MLFLPRKNSLDSLFEEVRAFKVLAINGLALLQRAQRIISIKFIKERLLQCGLCVRNQPLT